MRLLQELEINHNLGCLTFIVVAGLWYIGCIKG